MTVPADDPRPIFARALDQLEQQVVEVRPEELGRGTPCDDYDVRALLGHMVAVLHKIGTVGAGGDARGMPSVIDGVGDDDWPASLREARRDAERVWGDDAILDRMVMLPWATLPGRTALDAYTHEFTAHSWDLAHATGRTADLDPQLAVLALEAFQTFAPPDQRDDDGQFAPVVAVPDDADDYTRLAAYLGRQP